MGSHDDGQTFQKETVYEIRRRGKGDEMIEQMDKDVLTRRQIFV
jgi:hypothetical protein